MKTQKRPVSVTFNLSRYFLDVISDCSAPLRMSNSRSNPMPIVSRNGNRRYEQHELSPGPQQHSYSSTSAIIQSSPGRDSSIRPPASPVMGHRQSFAENLRSGPGSPRSQRQPSLSQSALQDLLSHPPVGKTGNHEFTERDWRKVRIAEIVELGNVKFVNLETSVEEATKVR